MIQTVFAHPDIYRDFDDPQINLIEAYIAAWFFAGTNATTIAASASRKANKFYGHGRICQ
ncbi:hypothetical protein PZ07_00095 [Lacticaseibacillus rhamnosus]|nr:hypothetical protein PZ07_00095 [Lacticaseibacillus rhamnosus]